MSDNSSASAIEVNGVNPVPDSERYGTPAGLFPIWFSWNISIFGITLGIYVLGLGLSVWQAMLAGVIGYFVSCALVGILAVGSVRTGLPTLVQSRFAFGYHGNKIPTFFGYVANMGWKVTMLSMASTTLADLMCHLVPVLAQVDGSPTSACVFGSFIVVIVLTMTGAVWGYQLIMKIEKAIAWITGLFTLVYLFFFIPQIDFSVLGDRPSAGIVEFLGAVVLSMTMVGLGFLNYGGDYSRYLPRNTRAGGVIFWTMTGIALPVSVLLILGVMLSAGNPELLAKASHEPIAALTGILPFWFYVPFSIVIIVSLISAGMTGVYSSGLALLAMGVPLSRAATTVVNAVIITLGAFYLLFISDSFVSTFQSFLAAISVIMGSWGAIEMVDMLRQKRLNWDVRMAFDYGEGGRSGRWTALLSLAVATIIGLGTITSSDPYIARIVSFLLPSGAETSVFAKANIGLVVAMIAGGRIVPPSIDTILRIMASPSPKPSFAAAFDRRSNAPNACFCSSSVMPVPVSSTTSVRTPLSYSVIKETPPSSVNLTAFDSRLFPICIIRSLSVNTMASCPVFTDKDSPLFTATGMNSVSSVCVIAEIRQGDRRGCSLPLSRRKKSSKVLSISRIRSEDCSIFWIYCPLLPLLHSFRKSSV